MTSVSAVSSARPSSTMLARVIRRTIDLVIAALALLLLLPVLAAIAIAIRLDSPGPVLFRQRRVGRDMAPFTILKFRTMHSAADEGRHRAYVQALIAGESATTGGLYKLAVDDRITRVGRFLRRRSLDELPQLLNVLRGSMSIVGPRPVIEYEVERYPSWYLDRFAVRPGLTGLWQTSGRNSRTYEEMVRLDVEYAGRQSLALDMKILFKTPWTVIRGRGAA
jgi:lipopolysaccharide/colanic/teichoic acid biosynthesis glycosyltransferase